VVLHVGTRAFAINSRGDVAGAYLDSKNRRHAFLLSTEEGDDPNSKHGKPAAGRLSHL